MKTTLTIDDDLAVELERLRRERNASLQDLANEALRRGLRGMDALPPQPRPFRTRSFSGGRLLVRSIDCVADLLAEAEGERFR